MAEFQQTSQSCAKALCEQREQLSKLKRVRKLLRAKKRFAERKQADIDAAIESHRTCKEQVSVGYEIARSAAIDFAGNQEVDNFEFKLTEEGEESVIDQLATPALRSLADTIVARDTAAQASTSNQNTGQQAARDAYESARSAAVHITGGQAVDMFEQQLEEREELVSVQLATPGFRALADAIRARDLVEQQILLATEAAANSYADDEAQVDDLLKKAGLTDEEIRKLEADDFPQDASEAKIDRLEKQIGFLVQREQERERQEQERERSMCPLCAREHPGKLVWKTSFPMLRDPYDGAFLLQTAERMCNLCLKSEIEIFQCSRNTSHHVCKSCNDSR